MPKNTFYKYMSEIYLLLENYTICGNSHRPKEWFGADSIPVLHPKILHPNILDFLVRIAIFPLPQVSLNIVQMTV